jgi:hypothetical protein
MPECSAKPGRGSKCDKNRSLSKLRAISEIVLPPASGAEVRAALLGQIAAAAEAENLVASHLGPADPSILSDGGWRKALRDGAKLAGFSGGRTLGADLMQIPVAKQ